ncbi:hypothetical protein MMC21_000497 [Puttea exsequens]|nr:hypothetical protein [Puttea exsequens]
MALVHIVQFKFKPSADESSVRDVCDHMLSLKDKCIRLTSQKPYIKSATGGKDNSPEGMQNGFTHAFVVEFESEDDRDFYVKKDEAHLAFMKSLDGLVDGAQILDYTPGKY